MIPADKWPAEGSNLASNFPTQQGTFPKTRVQSWRKVAMAGCTPFLFRLNRVKVRIDQSASPISRRKKVCTLLCRFIARVYPVVTFTLYICMNRVGTARRFYFFW